MLKDLIKNNFLILDGAMGTMLQKSGLKLGEIPEVLNITNPSIVTSIQKQYVDAGSDMILACTFGANEKKLSSCQYSVEEIINAAVNNAQATGAKYVGLDIGPIGELLSPTGTLSFDNAYEIFVRQIKAGVNAGVDAIYIETMTDLLEAKAAILAAKEHSSLPIFCTMSFEANGRTFLGVPPESAAITLEGLGVDALGINCSLGPVEILPIAKKMAQFTSLPMILKANAGLPDVSSGKLSYSITPEEYVSTLKEYILLGFSIFGGCCGTDPNYIKLISEEMKRQKFVPNTLKSFTAVCSGTKFVNTNQVCIIGERINPTGKKRFKEALLNDDIDYIISQGIEQCDAGAHILDVNVGLPSINEAEMMYKVAKELQAVLDAPLQLDSNSPQVIEKTLRSYNGIPIINSVNGEEKSLSGMLPLAAKYGGVLVALTLDENGIPKTAQGRLAIAKKIIDRAKDYGISKDKIIIDCLTLTISAESDGALETLKSLSLIKENLGVKTVLGVSNISFGLPQRELINSHFLALALRNGLDFAIINPNSFQMKSAVDIHNLIHLKDEGSQNYITIYGNQTSEPIQAKTSDITVEYAILKGLGEECALATKNLLEKYSELDVVSNFLIPSLDKVGILFEENKLFLPQLIRSAEAAKYGFDVINQQLSAKGIEKTNLQKIILATVKGDIHDIGKNIVKVVLENYGYSIIDLGRDVAIEEIAASALKHNASIVGLSALMTTTLPSMAETIVALKSSNYQGKIMVGGAVLTPEYANLINADFYAKDTKASVDFAKKIIG